LAAYHGAVRAGLVSAALAVGHGGLAVAAARMAIGGGLGLTLDVALVPSTRGLALDAALYNETAGRLLVAVPAARAAAFMVRFQGLPAVLAGRVTATPEVVFTAGPAAFARHPVAALAAAYRTPLDGPEHAA
jgi:phosphoribosylformylglycinamidine synthase